VNNELPAVMEADDPAARINLLQYLVLPDKKNL
jgi:hypothetical protein